MKTFGLLISGATLTMMMASCNSMNKSAKSSTVAYDSASSVIAEVNTPPSTTPTRVFTDTLTIEPYDIPAQRFDETAQALCHASGCSINTDLSKTGSIKVNPVKGRISLIEAVRMAIKGTKLEITQETPTVITVALKQ